MFKKHTNWDSLSSSEQEALHPLLSHFTCVGIHKVSHAFQVTDGESTLLIKPADMEMLIHNGVLPPHHILLWTGHGPRYMDFNSEFLEMAKLVMTLSGLQGSFQHRRKESHLMSAASCVSIALPSGHHMVLSATLEYTPLGVKLNCEASIVPEDGIGRLFMQTEMMLPDDKPAIELMATMFQKTCTRKNILDMDAMIKD